MWGGFHARGQPPVGQLHSVLPLSSPSLLPKDADGDSHRVNPHPSIRRRHHKALLAFATILYLVFAILTTYLCRLSIGKGRALGQVGRRLAGGEGGEEEDEAGRIAREMCEESDEGLDSPVDAEEQSILPPPPVAAGSVPQDEHPGKRKRKIKHHIKPYDEPEEQVKRATMAAWTTASMASLEEVARPPGGAGPGPFSAEQVGSPYPIADVGESGAALTDTRFPAEGGLQGSPQLHVAQADSASSSIVEASMGSSELPWAFVGPDMPATKGEPEFGDWFVEKFVNLPLSPSSQPLPSYEGDELGVLKDEPHSLAELQATKRGVQGWHSGQESSAGSAESPSRTGEEPLTGNENGIQLFQTASDLPGKLEFGDWFVETYVNLSWSPSPQHLPFHGGDGHGDPKYEPHSVSELHGTQGGLQDDQQPSAISSGSLDSSGETGEPLPSDNQMRLVPAARNLQGEELTSAAGANSEGHSSPYPLPESPMLIHNLGSHRVHEKQAQSDGEAAQQMGPFYPATASSEAGAETSERPEEGVQGSQQLPIEQPDSATISLPASVEVSEVLKDFAGSGMLPTEGNLEFGDQFVEKYVNLPWSPSSQHLPFHGGDEPGASARDPPEVGPLHQAKSNVRGYRQPPAGPRDSAGNSSSAGGPLSEGENSRLLFQAARRLQSDQQASAGSSSSENSSTSSQSSQSPVRLHHSPGWKAQERQPLPQRKVRCPHASLSCQLPARFAVCAQTSPHFRCGGRCIPCRLGVVSSSVSDALPATPRSSPSPR